MKKVSLLILVSLILLLAFTSCDMLPESVSGKLEDFKVKVEIMIGLHEHAWTEATCESAKTCETCGEIEGEALGHNWSDATCDAPKTCSVCAKTEGAALGHEWVDATCESPKTCSVCKKTEGAALGHKWTAPSCESAKTCSVCGETDGSALGHAFTNYVSNGDATCTADGTKTAKCDRCDVTDTIVDEGTALGHIYTYECDAYCARCNELTNENAAHKAVLVPAVEPTCTAKGNNAYYTCELCGKCWKDAELKYTTDRLSEILDVVDHQYLYPCDTVCMVCHELTNPEAAHSIVYVDAKAATCTVDGNNAYYTCEHCGNCWKDEALAQTTNRFSEIIVAPGHQYTYACDAQCNVCYEITNPEAAHTITHVEAKAATCFEDGNLEYWTCSDCGYYWLDEELTMNAVAPRLVVPAEHKRLVHQEAIEPACHYNGQLEHWICYACEFVWTDEALTQQTNIENIVVPALGGDVVHVEAAPSCYEDGNVEYWYCEKCEQVWQDEALTQLTNFMNVKRAAGTHEGLVHFDAVEAACHYTGNIEYWHCYDCETVWTDEALTKISNVKSVIVPAKGSNRLVHNEAIEPGCHYDGQIEHWICYECEQVWTDEALTQVSNVKNVILPATNDPAAIHVEAVAPSCTENGNIEYWYCEACGQVWADEARTQLTNRMNVILPAVGHNYTESTCQTIGACTVCGESDTEFGCHVIEYDVFENKFYCVTDGCDASFVPDEQLLVYDGSSSFMFNKNGDPTVNPGADGEYVIKAGKEKSQYMIYGPSNDINHPDTMTGWTAANNAFGVFSFRIMPNDVTDIIRVIVMSARNNPNWDANILPGQPDAWTGNSIDILDINPNGDGTFDISGRSMHSDKFITVNGNEWVDVKMFMQISPEGIFSISYYINGEFFNVYVRDLLDPEVDMTIKNLSINNFYICGWTAPGTGFAIDDIYFGYAKNSEWKFDEHVHSWIDATCTDAKYCELCGETEGEALGHTDGEVVKENVVLPNCTETGSHDDVVYCTVCNAEVSRTPVVDAALGHTDEVVPGYAATCTEFGLTDGAKCSVCGVTTLAQESIDPLGHADEDGNELCDVCGADLACKHPTTEPVEGKAPTCTATGLTAAEKCTVCQEIIGQEVIPALGHTAAEAVAEEVVLPTCTEAGSHYDAVYCSVCNELISRTKVVDAALDHDYIDNAAQAPDCTNAGWDAYQTCSRCDYTTYVEIAALGHDLSAATCQAGQACSRCDHIEGEANPVAHVLVHDGATNTYSCELCDYSYKIEIGNYSNGTNYNGISANAPQNTTYYTTNPDNANYPVLAGDYLEFVRKTDVEGAANTTRAQLQLWLPTTGGVNELAGFSSANHAEGYLSFSINAYTDSMFSMQLVDNTTDYYDVNGDGVVDQATERIRWGELWAISGNVFSINPPANGKVEFKGYNGVLATFDVDENNYSGWVDVVIGLVLDPDTDTITVNYYINGEYLDTAVKPLTTHSNSINCVYLNSNNTAAGTGYQLDNLAFGYTAHTHDLEITEANGVMTLACACGASYTLEDYREWNGDGKDSAFTHSPNGKVDTVYNEDGTWGFIFNPVADSDWNSANGAPGGQFQPWMPSSNRDENVLSGFSCENNAVGVIAFTMKTNVTRHADRDTNVTLGVGKPRNASNWNDGGSWTDDFIQILVIDDYLETGVTIRGGVNASMNLATIPVADGWSEWFDVMISIEMLDTGYMNTYYYINGVYCGSYSRDLSKADADGRYLDPKEIEVFQFSGWTYAANTGIMLDDLVFGYTAGGHNMFNGQYHKLTETTCGEKSTCTCGWTGYTLAHDLTEATCGAPATCKGCGMTVGSALTHNNLTASANNGVVTYNCTDCGKQYVLDGGMLDVNDMAVTNADNSHTYTLTDGTYSVINGGIANGQHQFWVPGQTEAPELADFTNANNALGFLSFSINANDHHNTGIEFKINANRGQSDWNGPTNNGWSDSSVGVFKLMPTAEGATTVAITGYNGASLGSIAVTGADGWTGWINVVIKMQLTSDNKISIDYYINGAYYANITKDMVIHTYEINSLYIAGRTGGEGQGYELKDVYFGYTLNGLQEVEEPFYNSEIAAEDVTSETLKAITLGKIKQCDNAEPVYVLANGKDGAEVEALYFSHTTGWEASSEANNYGFVESRWAVNANVTSISFDYIINGTLNGVSASSDGTWIDGTVVPLGNSLVQVKCGSTLNGVDCDGYPEIPNSSLTADGEWHTFTVTFDEPLDSISHFLVKLYNLEGEFLISNINVTYAE